MYLLYQRKSNNVHACVREMEKEGGLFSRSQLLNYSRLKPRSFKFEDPFHSFAVKFLNCVAVREVLVKSWFGDLKFGGWIKPNEGVSVNFQQNITCVI